MTDYGVTPSGFVRKTETDIIESLERRQLATVAPDLDVSAESIPGQMNAVYGRELGIAWEQLEVLDRSFDPDNASDDLLESLCKLTGTPRRGAEPSLVLLTCTLTAGTVLNPNEHQAAVEGNPDSLWTPVESFEAPSDGVHTVMFKSMKDGAIVANENTITVIHATANGWTAVNNGGPATPGHAIDIDAILRERREAQLAATGSATVAAIQADLSKVSGVVSALVYQNVSDDTNGDGVPPKAIEAIVYDGSPPVVLANTLAQTIFDSMAGGVGTFGNTSGSANNSGSATVDTINFSRPVAQEIYLELDVTTGSGYIGDTALEELVSARANETFGPNDDVVALVVRCLALEGAGVTDVPAIRLGLSASPGGTANLPITLREIARFDPSRITITVL